MKKLICVVISCVMILSCFAGCGKDGSGSGDDTSSPYEIVFVYPGDPANDMDVCQQRPV